VPVLVVFLETESEAGSTIVTVPSRDRR